MATTAMSVERPEAVEIVSTTEPERAGVSWGAIIAGAFAACALTVVLVALGSGIGLSAISPWPQASASLTKLKMGTIVGLIVVQWLSAGLGGYLTGRLRTAAANVHSHETYFRDSANGFVAWAVATVLVALVFSSGLASAIGTGARSVATVAGGAAQGASQGAAQTTAAQSDAGPSAYYVDTMFRADAPNANAADRDVKAETGRIMVKSLRDGSLAPPDRAYLAKQVAVRTGLSQADAEKRVDDTFAQAKEAAAKAQQAADAARKAAAQLAIFTALAMMIGAFIAASAAALGGAHRDEGWGYPPL
jgi:hypothetical protein